MPIRPEHRWLYPIDWRELSQAIRFGRAKGRCESCGRPHGLEVRHLGDGRWWDEARSTWRTGDGRLVEDDLKSKRLVQVFAAIMRGSMDSYMVTLRKPRQPRATDAVRQWLLSHRS